MTAPANLAQKASHYLNHLCLEISNRRVGSPGNRQATTFFGERTASFGCRVDYQQFDCLDWEQEGARLEAGGERFQAFPSPYSLACRLQAPLAAASSLEELASMDIAGKTLLLRGEIAREQLMPKNFPFYNPEHHQRTVSLLESKGPLAIIAATSRDHAMAGGVYPFPLIEDGDFDIPSVYMTAEQGERLLRYGGKEVALESRARRIPSTGCNVVARVAGQGEHKVVLTAHIDAKLDSPGALDNASGVVILLLLAEVLQDYQGENGIELVAINGEDYYSAIGEVKYLEHNKDRLSQVRLNINLDGAGFHQGGTTYSLYACPEGLTRLIRQSFASHNELHEGEAWYAGDHMIFVQNGVPAIALTSERAMLELAEITHTPRDRPELVDPAKLADVAIALKKMLLSLAGNTA